MNPVSSRGSTTVESLTLIWQRVLQISSLGVDDNFFELGGDSSLSLELFDEIARVLGRELPPVMIYHAPTISALAALLEAPAVPRVPALVQMKAGSDGPSIFITHGLGGSVMDFYQVVKHIQTSHPMYGLQARGIDGMEEPRDRIEDMARDSLDAMKKLQPHGPYYLVGFSLGGLVTLEMAQQLVASGENVALLAMLDSYPHVQYLSFEQHVRLSARQAWRRLSRKLRPHEAAAQSSDVPLSPALQRFRDGAYVALEHYQPRFYPGKINFVRAAIPTDFPADPVAVWAHLAREFDVETVPGDHLGIVTTHFESLAAAISRCVTKALS
jgi:acetoacetyl-CoA synthetase